MSRRVDASTAVDFVLLLPELLSSLMVMGLLGSFLMPRSPWLIAVVWLLASALIFLPAAEKVFARMKFRVRRPNESELGHLLRPWTSVCRVAGVPHDRYTLWIEESDGVNALAAGGHIVAVTRSALRLPPPQLEAILAHELGHHLSGHAWMAHLGWYYSVPARLSVRLAALVLRVLDAVGRFLGRLGFAFAELAVGLCGLFLLIALISLNPWLLLLPVTSLLLAWSSRLAETRADRVAARLGYGQDLVDVLRMWMRNQVGPSPRGRRALLATHPSHQVRIAKLMGHMHKP
ncbi:hypothetical protein ALI144C_48645 [Actinosynnema sp. ALI-1.44]|uniref:M48 family metalloprotease n=1 Tax=Actinosynnema sp. ALI-1.44 TaxID=1933779 RepID=UPI00097C4EBD|nr:M48 family metalloprotease [Actinosynnema sp. ALI-1.44]ONI71253.1 hypothetical protein ALI144C_48645 [Actinosynnema sp. ALI-1.44]